MRPSSHNFSLMTFRACESSAFWMASCTDGSLYTSSNPSRLRPCRPLSRMKLSMSSSLTSVAFCCDAGSTPTSCRFSRTLSTPCNPGSSRGSQPHSSAPLTATVDSSSRNAADMINRIFPGPAILRHGTLTTKPGYKIRIRTPPKAEKLSIAGRNGLTTLKNTRVPNVSDAGVRRKWANRLVECALPVLQSDFSQQLVHAYSFVRSPMIMQPASQLLMQRRSSDHSFGVEVEFSVLVV
uniref:Uncharacterized protein n=1 Tax=Anopheles atroparvus TaxID=41427 RepID=A0A182J4D3_ANOAO